LLPDILSRITFNDQMNKILYFFLAFVAFTLPFSSCSKDEESDNSFSNVTIQFFEQFKTEGRQFVFYLETVEQFPCNNFLIKTVVNDSDHILEIKAQSIDASLTCINTLGPATRLIHLGEPEKYSKKNVFWVNDSEHEFHFNVSENKISVEKWARFDGNLIFTNDNVLRIPDYLIWGYIIVRDKSDRDILNELLSSFYELGATEHALEDGDYHFFAIDEGKLKFSGLDAEIRSFGFLYHGDMQELVDLSNNVAPGVRIRLFDTLGNDIILN
jgi:hypothetical protein